MKESYIIRNGDYRQKQNVKEGNASVPSQIVQIFHPDITTNQMKVHGWKHENQSMPPSKYILKRNNSGSPDKSGGGFKHKVL